MQHNPNQNRQFLTASMFFMNQSTGINPQQRRQTNSIQNKRNTFANEVRQQQRNDYRRKMRNLQFNFLSDIGVNRQQRDNHQDKLMDYLSEQSQNSLVQRVFGQVNQDDQKWWNWLKDIYEAIQIYRYRDYELSDHPSDRWKDLRKKMGNFIKEGKVQSSNQIDLSRVQQDLQFVVHLISKQIHYQSTQWHQIRVINPRDFGLISQWLYKICGSFGVNQLQSKQQNVVISKIIMNRNVLITLLIHFNIKMQFLSKQFGRRMDERFNYELDIIDEIRVWEDKSLLEDLLRLGDGYRLWILIQQTNTLQVDVYGIVKINELIQDKIQQLTHINNNIMNNNNNNIMSNNNNKININNSNNKINFNNNNKINSNINNNKIKQIQQIINQINDLLYCLNIILQQLNSKQCRQIIFNKIKYNNQSSQQLLSLTVFIIQSITKSITHIISISYHHHQYHTSNQQYHTSNHQSNTQLSQLYYKISIKLINLDFQTQSIYLCLTENIFKQSCQTQQLRSITKMHEQSQPLYQKFLAQHIHQLQSGHFIIQQLKKYILSYNKSFQNQQHQYLTNKLQLLNGILNYTLNSYHNPSSNTLNNLNNPSQNTLNSYDNPSQSIHNNLNTLQSIIPNQRHLILKLTTHILKAFSYSIQRTNLVTYIFNNAEQIISLQQLQEIFIKHQSEQHKFTYLLLKFIQQLFIISQTSCNIFKSITQLKYKNQQTQKQQATIICQLHTCFQILNCLAQTSDNKYIWKYAALTYQLTSHIFNPKLNKSLFNHLQNLYIQLNRFKSGNIKQIIVKSEIVYLCQYLVYYVFPLQSSFKQFDPTNKQKSIKIAKNLLSAIITQKQKNDFSNKNNTFNDQDLEIIFSAERLDSQTESILELASKFLDETSIELCMTGIKIPYILLVTSPSYQVFNYFQNYIKSTTKIYQNIQNIYQNHEHDDVVNEAQGFIQTIDGGYEQLNDYQNDDTYSKDIEI